MESVEFKYDVFLSHSSKDKHVVRDVAKRLKTDGLRVCIGGGIRSWVRKTIRSETLPSRSERAYQTGVLGVMTTDFGTIAVAVSRISGFESITASR